MTTKVSKDTRHFRTYLIRLKNERHNLWVISSVSWSNPDCFTVSCLKKKVVFFYNAGIGRPLINIQFFSMDYSGAIGKHVNFHVSTFTFAKNVSRFVLIN